MESSHLIHPEEVNEKSLKIIIYLLFTYFVIEIIIGIWARSVAVIGDAFHSFTAVGGVLIALIAGQFARKKANYIQTFGLIRAEIVGVLLNSLLLFLMAGFVIWRGILRLQNPTEVILFPMFLAAAGGIIFGFISMGILWKKQKDNLGMKGAFWHVLQTSVSSVLVLVAALSIKVTGFFVIDSLLGILFGLVLIVLAGNLLKSALNIILEKVPKDVNLKKVMKELKNLSGVKDIHHIHAWSLTSGKNIFSAHVLISDIKKSKSLQEKIHNILKNKFKFYFSTVQLEVNCLDEEDAKDINLNLNKDDSKKWD